MKTSGESLLAGLREISDKESLPGSDHWPFMLCFVQGLVGDLIEGDAWSKKYARRELKKIIGRGRCILNAADLAAREKQRVVGGQVTDDLTNLGG